jgi:putative ABC transport system permease protein
MARFDGVRRLLRITRNRAGIERAVDDELGFHFDMTMRELMANGMTPDEARKETKRRFGDLQRTRERLATIDRSLAGQERRAEWWNAFSQDVRYALRGLRLKPGFAAAVIATLGLGIGANATMFGIVDRLLFRPPNLLIAPERASRLYMSQIWNGKDEPQSGIGYRRFLDLKENTTSFEAMTPYYTRRLAIGIGDAAKEMTVAVTTPDVWKMFDVKPALGRFFTADENDPKNPVNVIVLSYPYWQTQYGGKRDILGATMNIGAYTYRVIGVAAEGFNGYNSDATIGFVPIAAGAQQMGNGKTPWYDTYNMTWFESFALRKPGVTQAAADADLSRAFQLSYRKHLEKDPKDTPIEIAKPHAFAGPVLSERGPNAGNDSKVATWLAGVAMVVLLIACANVANLLLARALRRRREIAVRIALGVSRGRLLTQLLIESVLLAVLGGLAGVATAQWGGAILRKALLEPGQVPSSLTDGRMLLFVAILAIAAGFLTGLAPALQAGRGDVAATLKAGSREGLVQRSRLRVGLLVTQAALSVVLLVGAGLFVRSLSNVQHIRLGYDADRLLYVSTNWRGIKADSVQKVQMSQQLLERAKLVPGVENAATALTVPFWMTWSQSLFVAGIDSVHKLGQMSLQAGSPELMATMGTRVIRGRGLVHEDDMPGAAPVMVVNESMAKKLWPNEDAIGKCIRVGADTMPCRAVVGIAEDVRRGNLAKAEMHYYMPISTFNPQDAGVFVRTRGPGAESAEVVRRALQPLMPGVAYVTVNPMSKILAPSMRSWKLGATMFAVFGSLALVLAAIGLYSVIAYNVTQRTHEMGVRVALGAQGRDVISLIVREGLMIVLPGVALGTAVALYAGRFIAPLLFDVSPKDPSVMTGVVVTLILVAITASWVPARRAARVDPNEALRSD